MRGKVVKSFSFFNSARITPAHAGKSIYWSCTNFSGLDHPRTCGEKPLNAPAVKDEKGSPPHMRGKVTPPFIKIFSRRITPAHAGKSRP